LTKLEVEVELAESKTSVGPGVPAGDPAREPYGDSVFAFPFTLALALFCLPFFAPDTEPDPGVDEEEPADIGGWGKGRKAALYISKSCVAALSWSFWCEVSGTLVYP
jgi:hypothetical protein